MRKVFILLLTGCFLWAGSMDLEFNYQTGEFTEKIPVDGVARDANRISFFVGVKAFLP